MMKFMGNSFLAALENVDNVMPFVISIENLLSQNSGFVGRSLGFKFSLHYGDVLYIETSYGNEVLGEDVNVVARLNELAQPNEMVVSQAALERMPSDYEPAQGRASRASSRGSETWNSDA